MKKTRITIIGNYLESLDQPLRKRGIFIDNMISFCHPFAMAGDIIKDNLKFCNTADQPATLLNLRKNLSNMLSRDVLTYCQNISKVAFGKEVKYSNTSDYIVIMNTNVGYSLWEKDGVIYSDNTPQNDFTTFIKKEYQRLSVPYPKSFNCKYFYDQFIKAITSEYDHNHIILIRTNSAQWYADGSDVSPFGDRSREFRNLIEELDDYFIQKTDCLVIDEQLSYIPPSCEPVALPFALSSKYTFMKYVDAIDDIINNKNYCYYKKAQRDECPSINLLQKRLNEDKLNENEKSIKFIKEHWMSPYEICNETISNKNQFFNDIFKLKRFLEDEIYKLSDYAYEIINSENGCDAIIDFSLLELYTEYMKLDINDVIAVFKLYCDCNNKEGFHKIIRNIVNNSCCNPIKTSEKFEQSNIDFLKDYPYIQPELKDRREQSAIYIRIDTNNYIVIDKTSFSVQKIQLDIKDEADYRTITENDYVCPIECADALCSNLYFYVERAKSGNGNKPVCIIFDSEDEFCLSLKYIDYSDILSNERFVIKLRNSDFYPDDYIARCDLSFLFKRNVSICYLGNGFNDQLRFYLFSRVLREKKGCEIYYDDIYHFQYTLPRMNNEYEICEITKEKIDDRLFSNILSNKLLSYFLSIFKKKNFSSYFHPTAQILYDHGVDHIIGFSNRCKGESSYPNIEFRSFSQQFDFRYLNMIFDLDLSYWFIYANPYEYEREVIEKINDWIAFPEFEDKTNTDIKNNMLTCDAVVIHFRRGDYANMLNSGSNYTDYNFYIDAIKKLQEIDDYPNKKYFIFSDDILWVKEHIKDVGLDLVGDSEIIFVEHNKGANSYKDMQLMTYGKIIIVSQSGLAGNAAFYSQRCEVFAGMRGGILSRFEKSGKKYKYSLEPLPRGKFDNWF